MQTEAQVFARPVGPRVITQERDRLEACKVEDDGSVDQSQAEDCLRQWTSALELTVMFATGEEAIVVLGLRRVGDVIREAARFNAYILNVTGLNGERVFKENRAALEPLLARHPMPPPETSLNVDHRPSIRATRGLLARCPIAQLELLGARFGLQDRSHRCRVAFDSLTSLVIRNSHSQESINTAGHAYAEGRLSIDEVAAVLAMGVPDAVALLEKNGFRRSPDQLRLPQDERRARLAAIRRDRIARGNAVPLRPELVAREVVASQRIEDIDARPWLRSP